MFIFKAHGLKIVRFKVILLKKQIVLNIAGFPRWGPIHVHINVRIIDYFEVAEFKNSICIGV